MNTTKTIPLYGKRHRGALKVKRTTTDSFEVVELPKPAWLRVPSPSNAAVRRLQSTLRDGRLHTVCEEASCPNIGECFARGTATFMILGDICTRRCTFCDVAHGRPLMPDPGEPQRLADTVVSMGISYVVITSVDRDDLDDGGATHFGKCIRAIRQISPKTRIEILTPDFKKCLEAALSILSRDPPEVFNHNVETVLRLYRQVRPGADYSHSLRLLRHFKETNPGIPTKSGLMLGLGETHDEIAEALQDLRNHGCEMVTMGQYLRPTKHHMPVQRYLAPDEFDVLKRMALELGFSRVSSGPLVRSSYHAESNAAAILARNAD